MAYQSQIVHSDPMAVLGPLFDKAKSVDEFEFACTLLRIRGTESPGWDPLVESNTVIHQLLALLQGPIDYMFRTRLLLFLYCHVTEMRDLYNIVGNLLRVAAGHRYTIALYGSRPVIGRKKGLSPIEKVEKIAKWAAEAGTPEVGAMFEEMLVREVRNAFLHSDYVLTPATFNIIEGGGVQIDELLARSVAYSWLFPRLELGINGSLAMLDLTLEHIRSYTADKVVKGRCSSDGSYIDVELTASPEHGLTGFRSLPRASPRDSEQAT